MHKGWYNRIYRNADTGASGGGAAGAGGQGGSPQGGQGGQKPWDEMSQEERMATFSNLWTTKPQPPQNQQQGNQGQPPQGQGGTPSDRLGDYLKSQNYWGDLRPDDMMNALKEGNTELFGKQLTQILGNMHQTLLANMDKFGQHYYNKAKTESMQEFGSQYQTDKLYDQIFSKRPELKLPAIAPMVKSTVKNLMSNHGMTQERAMEETIKFFDTMGSMRAPANMDGGRGQDGGNFGPPGGSFENGKAVKTDYDALWG